MTAASVTCSPEAASRTTIAVREKRSSCSIACRLRANSMALAGRDGNAVTLDQRVEIVPVVSGKKRARELDGAQARRTEIDAGPLEFVLEEAVIKAGIVGDEQTAFQSFEQRYGQILKARGRRNHRCIDSRQAGDEWRYRPPWIDQAAPLAGAVLADFHDADLDDPVVGKIGARRFEVQENQWLANHLVAHLFPSALKKTTGGLRRPLLMPAAFGRPEWSE